MQRLARTAALAVVLAFATLSAAGAEPDHLVVSRSFTGPGWHAVKVHHGGADIDVSFGVTDNGESTRGAAVFYDAEGRAIAIRQLGMPQGAHVVLRPSDQASYTYDGGPRDTMSGHWSTFWPTPDNESHGYAVFFAAGGAAAWDFELRSTEGVALVGERHGDATYLIDASSRDLDGRVASVRWQGFALSAFHGATASIETEGHLIGGVARAPSLLGAFVGEVEWRSEDRTWDCPCDWWDLTGDAAPSPGAHTLYANGVLLPDPATPIPVAGEVGGVLFYGADVTLPS